jgi:hypothetical protein
MRKKIKIINSSNSNIKIQILNNIRDYFDR